MKIHNNANINVFLEPLLILYLLIVFLDHKVAICQEILQDTIAYFIIAHPESLEQERQVWVLFPICLPQRKFLKVYKKL